MKEIPAEAGSVKEESSSSNFAVSIRQQAYFLSLNPPTSPGVGFILILDSFATLSRKPSFTSKAKTKQFSPNIWEALIDSV